MGNNNKLDSNKFKLSIPEGVTIVSGIDKR